MNYPQMPTVEFFRETAPVRHDEDRAIHLGEVLVEQTVACTPGLPELPRALKVIDKNRAMRATIVGGDEIRAFHEDIGVTPNERLLSRLETHVLGALGTHAVAELDKVKVVSLSYDDTRNRGERFSALGAQLVGGALVPGRRKAIAAIADFHEVDSLKGTVFEGFQDHVAARIAMGKQRWQADVLKATRKLHDQDRLQVPVLTLGRVSSQFYQ